MKHDAPPPEARNARRMLGPRAWSSLGLGLGALGVGLYVALLSEASLRSSGLPAFAGLSLGLLLALGAWRAAPGLWTRLAAVLMVALTCVFLWLFFWVARLPPPTTFERLETAPDFALAGSSEVILSSATARGPVLLVFYRGHW